MREYELDPTSGASDRALQISESGRALSLLDMLSAREGDPASPRQFETSQKMLQLRMEVEHAYDQRLRLMLEGGSKREMDANADTLTEAIDTLERAEDEQKAAAATSPPTPTRRLSAAEIISASRTLHSTLIEYMLGANHSYAWVIDDGKIESYVLPPRDRIESAVKEWRALATARIAKPGESFDEHRKRVEAADKQLPQVAADLSCMLLSPFLRPHMQHLAIVPDGELQMLPFAALPEDGCHEAGRPIATERDVFITPSLSILLTRQPSRPESYRGDVALIADPVFDGDDPRVHRTEKPARGSNQTRFTPALPRLLGTREEANAIFAIAGPERAALYLDFDANLKTLFDPSLTEYRILHLAAHGILDEGRPGFSGIVLSLVDRDGHPIFGYLNTEDIASLHLRSDLVVLSSCDSAAGANLSGEGVTGLNHSFLGAGARRVVSTLWSVDDDASKELITAFYSGMLRDGLDPAEALRRSQVIMMRNARTAAPFYWAAFTITSTLN